MGKKRIYSVPKRPFMWPRPKENSRKCFPRCFSPDITDRQSSIIHTDLVLKKESYNRNQEKKSRKESAGVCGPEVIVTSMTPRVLYSSRGLSPDITDRQSRRPSRGKPMTASESSHLEEPVCRDGNHDEQDGQPDAQTLKMAYEAGSASCTETVQSGNTADVTDFENIIVKCEANDLVFGWSPSATDVKTALVLNKESHNTQESEGLCAQEVMVAIGTPHFSRSSGGFSPDITYRQNRRARRPCASSGSSDLGEPLGREGNHEEPHAQPDTQILKMPDEASMASYEEMVDSGYMEAAAHVHKKESCNNREYEGACAPEVMEANVTLHVLSSDIEGIEIATNEPSKETYSTAVNGIGQEIEEASMIPEFSNAVGTGYSQSMLPLFQSDTLLAAEVQSDSESGLKILQQEPDVVILANVKESKGSTPSSVATPCLDSREDNLNWCVPSPEPFDDFSSSAVAAIDEDNNVQYSILYTDFPPGPSSLLAQDETAALASNSLELQEHEETLTVMAIYDSDKSALNALSCTTELAAHIPKVCEENRTVEEGDEKPIVNFCDESFDASSESRRSDDVFANQCAYSNNKHEELKPAEHLISQTVLNCEEVMEWDICTPEILPPVSPQQAVVLQAHTAGEECPNKVQNTRLTESSIPVSEMEELVTTPEASSAMLPTDSESANNGCDCHGNPERDEDRRAGQEITKAMPSKANSLIALKGHKKLYSEEHRATVYGDKQFVVCRTDLHRVKNRLRNISVWRIHRNEKFLRKFEPITIDERDCHHGVNVFRQMPIDDDYLVIKFQPVLVFMVIDTRNSAVCVVFEELGSAPLLGYFPASEWLFPDFVQMLTNTILVAVGEHHPDRISDSSDRISGLVREVSNTECFSLLFPFDLMDVLKLYSSITQEKLIKKFMCITCRRLGVTKPATSTIMVGGRIFNKAQRNSYLAHKNDWKLCGSCVKYANTFQKLHQFKSWLLTSYRVQLRNLYALLNEDQKYDINDVVQFLRGDNLHNRLLFYEFLTTYFTVIEAKKDIEAIVNKAGRAAMSASAYLSRKPASTSNVESITRELAQEAAEKFDGYDTEASAMKTNDVFVFRAERCVTRRIVKKRKVYSPGSSPVRKVRQRTTVSKPLDKKDSNSHRSYPTVRKPRRTLTKSGVLKGPVPPKEECAAHLADLDVKTGSARRASRKVTSELKMLVNRQALALHEASQVKKTGTVRRRQFNSKQIAKPNHNATQFGRSHANEVSFPILTVSIPLKRLPADLVNRLCGRSGASSHCTQKKSIQSKRRRI